MTPAPSDIPQRPLSRHKSLRARGWFTTLALLAYVGFAAVAVTWERASLASTVQAQQRLAALAQALSRAESATAQALGLLDLPAGVEPAPAALESIERNVDDAARALQTVALLDAESAGGDSHSVQRLRARLALPSPARWSALRDELAQDAVMLDRRSQAVAVVRGQHDLEFSRRYDAVTVLSVALGLAGVVGFGSATAWYFARLAADVRKLESHARRIVLGQRGGTLRVRRDDELGRLGEAINHLQAQLSERERRLELESQQHAYRDRMAAVSALAAGFAHEVNNPLSVISGTAQSLQGLASIGRDELAQSCRTIVEQAAVAGRAAQRLAEAAAQHEPGLGWLDLLAMTRQQVQLIGYDRRYRQLELRVSAQPGLPALFGSGDSVHYVLQRLLHWCVTAATAHGAAGALNLHLAQRDARLVVAFAPLPPAAPGRDDEGELQRLRTIVEPLAAEIALDQGPGGVRCLTLQLPLDITTPTTTAPCRI